MTALLLGDCARKSRGRDLLCKVHLPYCCRQRGKAGLVKLLPYPENGKSAEPELQTDSPVISHRERTEVHSGLHTVTLFQSGDS